MRTEDLTFSGKFILRTPVLPFSNLKSLEVLLKDDLFKDAIRAASLSLSVQLEKSEYRYGQLDEKGRESIRRYRNRMMYRPVPFGKFAAISVAAWGTRNAMSASDRLVFHRYADFSMSITRAERYPGKNTRRRICYIVNPALYRIGESFRYITCFPGSEKRIFEISELPADAVLLFITHCCRSSAPYGLIVARLMEKTSWGEDVCMEYVDGLISAAVIVPELAEQLNITGTDYLNRKGSTHLNDNADNVPHQYYVITEREMEQAVLDSTLQEKIKQGLAALAKLAVRIEQPHLQEFKKQFIGKYDRRAVPLLEVLDPGAGIGYGPPSVLANHASLLQGAGSNSAAEGSVTMQWTPVYALLMKAWLANENRFRPIILDESLLSGMPLKMRLPNSLTVLFRLANEMLWIESAGGATGTAMMGRFTLVSSAICETAKELVSNEETANPDVAFAEICHIEDTHTANIDRRENLYRYEIPLICGSLVRQENQIALSDLFVSVSNNEVVLWSARLSKRVIPRLSSAYNYARSNLPVFRFLCDLQHQGIDTVFTLNLETLFPGLSFYPRVQLGETIILSPATWIITRERTAELCSQPPDKRITAISQMAVAGQWARYIIAGGNDQGLVLDTHSREDIARLGAMLKPERNMTIREFIGDNAADALVCNARREGFINQFAATLYHSGKVYEPYEPETAGGKVKRAYAPGSEWLYYKIYMHPAACNEVLVESVVPAINDLIRQGLVRQWFFIRYRDPEYHIRLRLLVKPLHTGWVLACLEKSLTKRKAAGSVRRFAVDTYEREIERYSAELIESCESFFCHSTTLIIAWLLLSGTDDTAYEYYFVGFSTVRSSLELFGYKGTAAVAFLQQRCTTNDNRTQSKQYNEFMKRQFREVCGLLDRGGDLEQLIQKKLKRQLKGFLAVVAGLAERTRHWEQQRRGALIGNLLHMHLNRLFVDNGPLQEAVLYYTLSRWLSSSLTRQKKKDSALAADNAGIDPV